MPVFEDDVKAIQFMHLLLFEGQASKGRVVQQFNKGLKLVLEFGSQFEIKLFENAWNQLQR